MKVYKYNPQSKEYTTTVNALIDPLETKLQGKEVYLLPANATFTAPSSVEGCVPVWAGEKWDNVEE